MQPIQPEQARFLLHGIYLGNLKNEHRTTRAVIHAMPADQGDYRPDPCAKSAIDLAWHIVVVEARFMDGVANGAFDLSSMARPDTVKAPADVLAWDDANFAPGFEKLTRLSDEQLLKVIDFRGIFQLPAVIYLNIVMHHSVHHRGQLSTYLRPMGGKVPAIYGESYDSARA